VSIRALIDTSVFIAMESGLRLDLGAPEGSTASVVMLAELSVGVLSAGDIETRSRRLATVAHLRSMELLPVTEAVAGHWARLRVLVAQGRRRVNVNDLWIGRSRLLRVGSFQVCQFFFRPRRDVLVVLEYPQRQVGQAVLAQGIVAGWWLCHGGNVTDNTRRSPASTAREYPPR
jgi:predicted nucleic acid-binding protein